MNCWTCQNLCCVVCGRCPTCRPCEHISYGTWGPPKKATLTEPTPHVTKPVVTEFFEVPVVNLPPPIGTTVLLNERAPLTLDSTSFPTDLES